MNPDFLHTRTGQPDWEEAFLSFSRNPTYRQASLTTTIAPCRETGSR